jgi:hypothetical protein
MIYLFVFEKQDFLQGNTSNKKWALAKVKKAPSDSG